jgi:hypothetical protein
VAGPGRAGSTETATSAQMAARIRKRRLMVDSFDGRGPPQERLTLLSRSCLAARDPTAAALERSTP